jgi:hypothetical protein
MSDLNERVQARLAQFQDLITNGYDNSQAGLDPFTSMFWDYQTALQPLVDSWRSRWDRHRPCPDVYTCQTCMSPIDRPDGYPNDDWTSEMCADGRAVLREIGIGEVQW